MKHNYFRTVKTLIKSFLQASGSAFPIFAQYFTTATLALVAELCLCLACQNVREKSKCKERSCVNCSWNQRGTWLPVLLQPRQTSRSTTDMQAVMCPHIHLVHLAFPSILTGTFYHTQVSSVSKILKEPRQKSRFILALLLTTMGNIFPIFFLLVLWILSSARQH